VTAEEAQEMIDTNPHLLVVDVREKSEYCNGSATPPGHIPGALNYPWNSGYLANHYQELPPAADILVVCGIGMRSAAASQFLCGEKGFTAVSNMLGGMAAWEGATAIWPCCDTAQDCDDGLFCSGAESCVDLLCQPGSIPCSDSYYRCDEEGDQCLVCTGDYDCDGLTDANDNCLQKENGPDAGTCIKSVGGVLLGTGVPCSTDDDCDAGESCQKNQEDYNNNGIGDVCECYGDITGDLKVALSDLVVIKTDFLKPCPPSGCTGDVNGDNKVDLSDLVIVKTQFLITGCPTFP